MKKLRLDPDALAVHTFDPAPPEDGRGTVLGEQIGTLQSCNIGCVSQAGTCYPSCAPTCVRTCTTCFMSCATCDYTCPLTCQFTCELSCPGCLGG